MVCCKIVQKGEYLATEAVVLTDVSYSDLAEFDANFNAIILSTQDWY